MSDFITNLARRVEPTVDVRPRVNARFESEQQMLESQSETPIQSQDAATSEPESVDRQWNRQSTVLPNEVRDPTPIFNAQNRKQRETPNLDVESSSTLQMAPPSDPKELLNREPTATHDVASNQGSPQADNSPGLDQKFQLLRELVADVERRVNLRPEAMPTMDTATQTPDLRPIADGPTKEIVNNTIIERYAKRDVGGSETESVTRPATNAPAQIATPSRQRRAARSRVIPSVQPEKTAAVRAAEAAANRRTVNIKIRRVEVKAVASKKPSEAQSAPRQQTGSMVMSLDDYVARRAAGGIG